MLTEFSTDKHFNLNHLWSDIRWHPFGSFPLFWSEDMDIIQSIEGFLTGKHNDEIVFSIKKEMK